MHAFGTESTRVARSPEKRVRNEGQRSLATAAENVLPGARHLRRLSRSQRVATCRRHRHENRVFAVAVVIFGCCTDSGAIRNTGPEGRHLRRLSRPQRVATGRRRRRCHRYEHQIVVGANVSGVVGRRSDAGAERVVSGTPPLRRRHRLRDSRAPRSSSHLIAGGERREASSICECGCEG